MNSTNTRVHPLSLFRLAEHARVDLINPACILALTCVGIFFIYSSQLTRDGTDYIRQIVWLGLGATVYIGISLTDYKFFLKMSHWLYFGSVGLLLLLWTPLGDVRENSLRWLDFGPLSLQPSETAKVGTLLITASILVRSEVGTLRQSVAVLGKLALAVSIPMFLILAQPDLGSALVIPPMVFALLFVSNLSKRFFLTALGIFAILVSVVVADILQYARFLEDAGLSPKTARGQYQSWIPLHDYQRDRILVLIAPELDPLDAGWNIRQSLISVGSGGLTGKGWTQGTQAQLGYLPRGVAHNDFIFSVLAEEKGFLGSVIVLGLFGVMLWNGIRIAGISRDRFGMLVALGATVLFMVHFFVNIAMTIGLAPITGIPLPFISYGGSFVLSCSILQGLVQSVYRFRKAF